MRQHFCSLEELFPLFDKQIHSVSNNLKLLSDSMLFPLHPRFKNVQFSYLYIYLSFVSSHSPCKREGYFIFLSMCIPFFLF